MDDNEVGRLLDDYEDFQARTMYKDRETFLVWRAEQAKLRTLDNIARYVKTVWSSDDMEYRSAELLDDLYGLLYQGTPLPDLAVWEEDADLISDQAEQEQFSESEAFYD